MFTCHKILELFLLRLFWATVYVSELKVWTKGGMLFSQHRKPWANLLVNTKSAAHGQHINPISSNQCVGLLDKSKTSPQSNVRTARCKGPIDSDDSQVPDRPSPGKPSLRYSPSTQIPNYSTSTALVCWRCCALQWDLGHRIWRPA